MDDQTKLTKSVNFVNHESDSEDSNAELNDDLNRQFNKFQLLDSADINETIDLEDDGLENNEASDEDLSQKKQQASNSTTPKSKSKRNNKRRNKNKSGKKKNNDLTDDCLLSTGLVENQARELNASQDDTRVRSVGSHLRLLKLDMKNLIPENEIKRMFGKSVLKEEKSKDSKGGRHYILGPLGNSRSRFSAGSVFESRVALVGSGPKMELDELFNQQQHDSDKGANTKKGGDSIRKKSIAMPTSFNDKKPTYFKFVHEKSYQTAHNIFLDAAQQGYSEAIIQNLNMFPAHVESLIQLSDMFKVAEDFKAASDVVERALLIFERGFHQKFNMALGNCRLSYRRPENRSFFITIFKHIMYLNRRGLRRTPLEYTKLLLSLDPENDPLFATLLVDFYSIRSEEYDYLIEFTSEWKHLAKLPNINFSLALAYFMKSKNLKRGKDDSENNLKLADQQLQTALIRYPNFIIPLLDACSGEPNAELKKCDYFDYSVYTNKYKTVPESIDLLVSLYVQRTLVLWKTKDVLSWLERNIAILVNKFSTRELVDEGQQIEYWSSFRGPSPRNLLRHIVLSDLKVKVPPSATSSTILDIDPYPPESITSYTRDNSTTPANQQADSNSSSFGFSSLFLRSILPSFNLGENPTERNPSNR